MNYHGFQFYISDKVSADVYNSLSEIDQAKTRIEHFSGSCERNTAYAKFEFEILFQLPELKFLGI